MQLAAVAILIPIPERKKRWKDYVEGNIQFSSIWFFVKVQISVGTSAYIYLRSRVNNKRGRRNNWKSSLRSIATVKIELERSILLNAIHISFILYARPYI